MSLEVHIDWQGQTHLVGRLHAAERGASVSFEYALEWLQRDGAFAIDPTSLPLQRGAHHRAALFGAIQDCGPDRWGRMLIERAVRKKVLTQKPYRDIDYVLALDVAPRFGLKTAEARKILREVFTAVSGWRTTGKRLRLKAATLDVYASAFQHPLMDEARQLLGR